MMKLGFSSNAFRKFPLSEAIETISRIGYNGIEIMCDAPHAYPPDVTDEYIQATRSLLQQKGLTVANLNAFMMTAARLRRGDDGIPEFPRSPDDFWLPSYIQSEPSGRRTRIEHTINCLRLAKEFGAGGISIEPGGPLEDFTEEEGRKRFAAALEEVIPIAEELGVELRIEPEPGLLIERSDQYLKFMERIDSPMVGLNLDIGHIYCVGEDPADAIRRLSDHIRYIQIEDIAATRVHQHLVPGDGAIDFDSVFGALRDVNYQGWVTVELYPLLDDPHTAAQRAYDYLKPYFD